MRQFTVSLRPIEGGTAEVTVLRQGPPGDFWYDIWNQRALALGYSIEVAVTESRILESIEFLIEAKERENG